MALAPAAPDARLRVEVWSDLVCPWCRIGLHRLRAAIRSTGIDAAVVHRAFQLDPLRRGTAPTRDMLAERYGADNVEAMLVRVEAIGRADGIVLRPGAAVAANTRDAHRLCLWAQERGVDLVAPLMRAHFEQSADLSDPRVLIAASEAAGLDGQQAEGILASDAFAAQVERDQEEAHSLETRGVPFFVVDGRFAVSGAQPGAVFEQVLREAVAVPADK